MPLDHSPKLQDYFYDLPEEFIAKFPLEKRDASRLLHFEENSLSHHQFSALPSLLPPNSHLFFNDTKVIPARIFFKKATGALIELFLLDPVRPSIQIQQCMESTGPVLWHCLIGNLKKWKQDEVLITEISVGNQDYRLEAILADRDKKYVQLSWSPGGLPFASLVEACGEVPLPPYLKRRALPSDKTRYQTIYSRMDGAVAAPTAGLHFTDKTIGEIREKGILINYLTLHVGAGTFQPVKHGNVLDHPMHREQMIFTRENIENLLSASGNIVAVGTTSMRSLESLYWFGVKLLKNESAEFFIDKLYPYQQQTHLPDRHQSVEAVLKYLDKSGMNQLSGATEIFIFPGYDFKICNGLITNFHQPGSTLMLLVAAFTKNRWRQIYQEAINEKYRFLSYGDSSLLWYDKINNPSL
ncbi:S-adenosylmethionine:tRNA ribosyltransferase-isomerase [Cyclobacterium lianum]|uniref:S-adenosylmethionine:tRNA ribosyltransferase-isomerase n=1 Tax=Cyclobacterium lianum TaxID=388280 RepID=A0A1M7MNN9_9BACT|nr:S-adenosylmethionine:tRNA ribosyltransferase-isomerase [Cyclobacterium lianum]SHM92615.1 S-adenosylmethionine:tRNA ribosyltransferase-isomerase [Cyclobacterium lianum]